jgi:xanthine dehydrogenase accessory factor
MIDILTTLEQWREREYRVAIATVIAVERSAPRGPGAALAVNERGDVAGSVSGGCVEGALYEEARHVLASGRPRLVTYGISDEEGLAVGLTCGGTIQVFVELLDWNDFDCIAPAIRAEESLAIATVLDGERIGLRLRVTPEGTHGTLGSLRLTAAVAARAQALLLSGETRVCAFGLDGEPLFDDVHVFVQAFAPKPRMYIFGAIDFSRAMATLAKYLGYYVVVVDARPVFATKSRIPDADEIAIGWPDEFLERAEVTDRTVLIVLTHDAKFDIPVLRVALRTNAAYIGVMGSRRTHAARLEALRAAGIGDDELARIRAPIGLDLGAQTPEETAVSIAAEIIALRHERPGSPLSQTTGPIHVPIWRVNVS